MVALSYVLQKKKKKKKKKKKLKEIRKNNNITLNYKRNYHLTQDSMKYSLILNNRLNLSINFYQLKMWYNMKFK